MQLVERSPEENVQTEHLYIFAGNVIMHILCYVFTTHISHKIVQITRVFTSIN